MYFGNPQRFPLSSNAYIVAPFWSDNDIRRSGDVYYVTLDSTQDTKLFEQVNTFISNQNKEGKEEKFEGSWMLIAQWARVHPYPHGSNYRSIYYSSFIDLVSLAINIVYH